MRKFLYMMAVVPALLSSCSQSLEDKVTQRYAGGCPIYPDYMDVTIPVNIAPLNFDYTDPASENAVTTFTGGGVSISFKGSEIRWNRKRWQKLLENSAGGAINVRCSAPDTSWSLYVSPDEIDYGLTYRLIEPGYELYSKMGVYERELSSYRQTALIENTDVDGCINCHSFNRCDPSDMSLHIRGDHGATLLRLDGKMEAYDTKTDHTAGLCVYPYWHPEGRFIAYSTNNTRQVFHTLPDKLIEVFDLSSDMLIYDTRTGRLIDNGPVCLKDAWETFPSFSPDGRTLYFCRAEAKPIPDSLKSVRYDLCSIDFNPGDGSVGDSVKVLVAASETGHSVSFPKPSFDGRYIMYTLSDYGQFSIWHHEADLWLYDTASGKSRRLDEVNSGDTESYHNWSSTSRWFVFSSRRDDGLFTRPYFAHIDAEGNIGKPFMLPQEAPLHFYSNLFFSYNIPEFVTGDVKFNHVRAARLLNAKKRTPFK